MNHELPIQMTGKWTFHLNTTQPVQLRITSEQDADAQLVIEGHDISILLDYLYEQRERIYTATHDQETLLREAAERLSIHRRERPRVRPIRYFYDGERRIREDQEFSIEDAASSLNEGE